MDTLDHPAIAVAIGVLTRGDRDLTPVTAIVRDEIVAVLVDGEVGRWIVFVQPLNDEWVAMGITFGSPKPAQPRADRTTDYLPLARKGGRFHQVDDGTGWYAVIGLAARDAVSVSVRSELEESIMPISEAGVAFALVRARWREEPDVYVHTTGGQRFSATLRQAG